MTDLRALLAGCLQSVLTEARAGRATPANVDDMVGDPTFDGELLEQYAAAAGFARLPRGLRVQPASAIDSAARGLQAPASAWVVATVMAAAEDPEHPLRAIASQEPEILDDLELVASGSAQALGEVEHQLDLVIRLAIALLGQQPQSGGMEVADGEATATAAA